MVIDGAGETKPVQDILEKAKTWKWDCHALEVQQHHNSYCE